MGQATTRPTFKHGEQAKALQAIYKRLSEDDVALVRARMEEVGPGRILELGRIAQDLEHISIEQRGEAVATLTAEVLSERRLHEVADKLKWIGKNISPKNGYSTIRLQQAGVFSTFVRMAGFRSNIEVTIDEVCEVYDKLKQAGIQIPEEKHAKFIQRCSLLTNEQMGRLLEILNQNTSSLEKQENFEEFLNASNTGKHVEAIGSQGKPVGLIVGSR